MTKTIEVETFFGNKRAITCDEYVKKWVDHAKEFHALDYKHYEFWIELCGKVEKIAEDRWNEIYKEQSKDSFNLERNVL